MTQEKKPSLVYILTQHLKEKRGILVHGGELERVGQANKHEGETAKRRMREMTDPKDRRYNPMIEKQIIKRCVAYRWRVELEVPEPANRSTPDTAGQQALQTQSLF